MTQTTLSLRPREDGGLGGVTERLRKPTEAPAFAGAQ
jgi:hypothetical protein